MHNIIVGFDFSSGSAHAVDLTIDIANRWQRDIRLVYVKAKGEDETPLRAEIEQRNANVAHLLKGIKLEYVIRQGNVWEELSKQASEDDADLVVVGTNGMSGFQTNWIGKNTYRTIAESPVPVLSVREHFNFNKALENIVVPLDNTLNTRQKVPMAAKFAKAFGSTVHILGLYTSDNTGLRQTVDGYVTQVQRFLEKNEIASEVKMLEAQKNLTETTLDYADSVNADMIVIMTEQESRFANFILGSFAQQMVHTSNRPILTIRPEDVNGLAK